MAEETGEALMAVQSFRVLGLTGVLDALRKLPPAIVSARGGPVKAALRKAALVILDQAKSNLRTVILEPNKDGTPNESTGLLEKNLVATRGKMPAGTNGERYLVRVRAKRYPQKGGKPVVTTQVGRLLEYGSEKATAKPWLRPAFDVKKGEAVSTFVREVTKRTNAIIKKLEREAKAKERQP